MTFFNNVSSNNETSSADSDTEANPNSVLVYLSLFGLPLGVLLVVVPALTVIIIVLKNRKVRRESSKIFYVNLLITDVVTALSQWIISSAIVIRYLFDVPNVNCTVVTVPLMASVFAADLMFLPIVMDRFLHIAFPFSYKRMFTTKRITVIISSLWLLSLLFGMLGLVGGEYTLSMLRVPYVHPNCGVCIFDCLAFLFWVYLISYSICACTYRCIYACKPFFILNLVNQDYTLRF